MANLPDGDFNHFNRSMEESFQSEIVRRSPASPVSAPAFTNLSNTKFLRDGVVINTNNRPLPKPKTPKKTMAFDTTVLATVGETPSAIYYTSPKDGMVKHDDGVELTGLTKLDGFVGYDNGGKGSMAAGLSGLDSASGKGPETEGTTLSSYARRFGGAGEEFSYGHGSANDGEFSDLGESTRGEGNGENGDARASASGSNEDTWSNISLGTAK